MSFLIWFLLLLRVIRLLLLLVRFRVLTIPRLFPPWRSFLLFHFRFLILFLCIRPRIVSLKLKLIRYPWLWLWEAGVNSIAEQQPIMPCCQMPVLVASRLPSRQLIAGSGLTLTTYCNIAKYSMMLTFLSFSASASLSAAWLPHWLRSTVSPVTRHLNEF